MKYFGHIFLGCWAPMIAALVLLEAINAITGRYPVAEQVESYVLIGLSGFLLGRLMAHACRHGAGEGRSAGLFPATVWLFFFLLELALQPSEVSGFFYYPTGPGGGEGGWGVILLTLPTWSCCWYSLGTRSRGTPATPAL